MTLNVPYEFQSNILQASNVLVTTALPKPHMNEVFRSNAIEFHPCGREKHAYCGNESKAVAAFSPLHLEQLQF